MDNVFINFIYIVALMIAGYFFTCSAISYGIDYYFKIKNGYEDEDSNNIEGDE